MSISTTRVCLMVVLGLQIATSLSTQSHKHQHQPKVHHVHGHNRKRNESSEFRPAEILIDAFDEDKCGKANLRPWQREQRAFGCAAASNKTGNGEARAVPFMGQPANDGEFPFFVNIEGNGLSDTTTRTTCNGVLIHNDIVLTTSAQCLKIAAGVFRWRPYAVRVRPGFDHFNKLKRDWHLARRWCTSSLTLGAGSSFVYEDLGVILLDKPIEYVPGKIGPACLVGAASLNKQHKLTGPSESTRCALVGYCESEYVPLPATYKIRLRTMPMKRDACPARDINNEINSIPYETCYRAQDGAGRCRTDQGNPVVCYDKCSKSSPDKVQAHVVGLLSQFEKSKAGDHDPISVIDLQRGRERLIELLHALMQVSNQTSETISCYKRPIER